MELFGQRNRFTIGINPTLETETDTNFQNIDGNKGSVISYDKTFAANVSLYTENQHYLTKSFSILTGCQVTYIERAYKDLLDSPVDGNQSNNEEYWSINPKIGALYDWDDKRQVYFNVSRSFQPPSFDESVTTADDGDQAFQPPQRTNWHHY